MIDQLLNQIKNRENPREALSMFRAAIKDEETYRYAREQLADGEAVTPFLMSEDAKVRKNAAALIGDLEIQEAASALYLAYQAEKTLFVRGTLLTALGKTNPYPYLEELKRQYDDLCSRTPEEHEKKHIREELHALEQILRKEGKESRHTFTGWEQRYTILLTTNPKYASLTADKFTAYRKKQTSLGVQAIVDNLREVTNIRTYRELLFPVSLGRKVTLEEDPEAFGEALLESKMLSLLERSHKEEAPFYFRIDMKCGLSLEERSRYIKRAAAAIEEKSGRKLINAPNDYEFEIRMLLDKAQNIHVFAKMFTIPMERFSYRKETISASIHPSLAAMLLELAKPYFKDRAQILDPCCGVGTMLAERHKIKPVREIYAIDIFGEAIDKARINTAEAGMRINFIHKDYLDFQHTYPFDEIIANMPMRGKRTKEEQDSFYKGFFDKSEELLAQDGILILYSNENSFIKKQLRLHPVFKLYQEYPIREKEQFSFYIIGMRR